MYSRLSFICDLLMGKYIVKFYFMSNNIKEINNNYCRTVLMQYRL